MTSRSAQRYLKLTYRLEKAEELLESLQEASNPKTPTADANLIYGSSRTSAVKDGIGNLITEIEDVKERIAYLKREVAREERTLKIYIENIHDESLRIAFRLKYLKGVPWAQIADIMGSRYTMEKLKKDIYYYMEQSQES